MLDVGDDSEEEVELLSCHHQNKQQRVGAMDTFVMKKSGRQNQKTLNQMFKKEERDDVCQIIAHFFYTSAIPFNCVNNPIFPFMVKKIGDYGKGLVPPSFHEIRVTFLKKEVHETLQLVDEFKEQWKKTGYTSNISKMGEKVFEILDEVVEKVEEENVVQVVTDNASNYKLAGRMLMDKRKGLFWTPCAAHCIDLMLEDFEKEIQVHRVTIGKGKKIVAYIYSRTNLIHWMKEFTKDIELIRPAVTRFATSYLTLRRLHEQKGCSTSR
ncbi:uncharacterized protein LOC114296593 [Camellia sinensis]|uniref:uncharacterized protein LOC114296593 n=1 Tax=Camellia sinensis TaxID=4442 RepID=UPI001035B714|nr:uncharacterized protein LOC114296593 [Camellia sinensis]